MSDDIAKVSYRNQLLGAGDDAQFFTKIHSVQKSRGIFPQNEYESFYNFLRENIRNSGKLG
jgi:hypothetical protein